VADILEPELSQPGAAASSISRSPALSCSASMAALVADPPTFLISSRGELVVSVEP
jgi:hypothetical protein